MNNSKTSTEEPMREPIRDQINVRIQPNMNDDAKILRYGDDLLING